MGMLSSTKNKLTEQNSYKNYSSKITAVITGAVINPGIYIFNINPTLKIF